MMKPEEMISFLNKLAAQFMKSDMENIAENLMQCSLYILIKKEAENNGKINN